MSMGGLPSRWGSSAGGGRFAARAARRRPARAPAASRAPVASASRRPARPRPGRTETEARTSLPRVGGGELVARRRSRRGRRRAEREAALVGLVDLDVEADAPAGEPAADAGRGCRAAGAACEVVDVEGDRRPAGARRRGRSARRARPRAGVDGGRWPSMSSWPRTLPARRVPRRRPAGRSWRGRAGRARVILEDDARDRPERTTMRRRARAVTLAPVRALTSLRARVQASPPGAADAAAGGRCSCWRRSSSCPVSTRRRARSSPSRGAGRSSWRCGVAARRRAPLVAAASVFAALIGHRAARQLGDIRSPGRARSLRRFIVSYSLGANLEGRSADRAAWRWLVALVTAPWRSSTRPPTTRLNLIWGWLVIVAAPVLVGRLLRDRARLNARAARAGRARSSAERVRPPPRGGATSARGSPASCTTSSRTR